MLTIFARNVAEALPKGLALLRKVGERQPSRAGDVLVAPCPVMTVFDRPRERVLLSAERDANPFFHLFEALWMLDGRNDAAFLNRFVKDFGERFAEPNGVVHGAYGFRWRNQFDKDQLDEVIRILKTDPNSRQAVITMWDPDIDLGFQQLKDRPCNTQIYLRLQRNQLDLTVTCRSNDILWGAYGANAVHFTILQEYLATHIGCDVGTFYQFSNNWHAYVSELEKRPGNMEDDRQYNPISLIDNLKSFDDELTELLAFNKKPTYNKFLRQTAFPMLQAHQAWRNKSNAEEWLAEIEAIDWRTAATEWIARRKKYVIAP